MIRILIALLLIASSAFATDFDDTDQMYGWDSSTGQFYQTWADFKAQLSLLYQAKDDDLDTYAGITPSANVQSLLSAEDWAAIRTLLGLGTAALLDSGSDVGDVVLWEDDGSGNASIGIGAVDLPNMADYSVNGTPFDGDANGKIDASLLDVVGGSVSITEQSSDPVSGDLTEGDLVVSTSSGDLFYKSATGFYTFAGSYSLDPTPPTLTSATIGTDGTTFTLVYSENLYQGLNYSDTFLDVDCVTAGNDIGLTYVSGDESDTHTYTLASTINVGDTCTFDFTPGATADILEDAQGDDLDGITLGPVTNDSANGGVACESGTIAHSFEDLSDSGGKSLLADAVGQGITPPSNITVHSIEAHFGYATSCDATLRIGTSSDLSTYLAEGAVSSQGTGWAVFDISSADITLTGSTQYYIGIVETAGDCRWSYGRSTGDTTYSGGARYNEGTGWALGSADSLSDLLFRVNECQ